MQVSLYPYNYWCLIAAFVLLLVFLVMTFLKARPLIRQLNTMKPQLTEIQNGITSSKIKADTIGTKAKKDVNQGSGVLSSLLILNAIRKDYRNADGSVSRTCIQPESQRRPDHPESEEQPQMKTKRRSALLFIYFFQ